MKLTLQLLSLILMGGGSAQAGDLQTFRSGPEQTSLLELFTSEGCSSCPPAEMWLSRMGGQKGLWKAFVPVSFHVDYWDGLGWKDLFARPVFTERQRTYAALWGAASVYTPDVVWNGQDWQGWSRSQTLPESDNKSPGVLEAEVDSSGTILVRFHPPGEWQGGVARVVLSGSGVQSDVKNGENSGRKLAHDFVALDYAHAELTRIGKGSWEAKFPALKGTAPQLSLVAWVELSGRQQPVQALGGWLNFVKR